MTTQPGSQARRQKKTPAESRMESSLELYNGKSKVEPPSRLVRPNSSTSRRMWKVQQPHVALQINGTYVAPSDTVKVLGVNLDSKLRMREHMQTVTRRATKQCVALGMLRGLPPAAMKQLYITTVASKMDYAASIWYKIQDRGQFAEKMLEGVQRLGARMVTGG
jgi:hypothetical protein